MHANTLTVTINCVYLIILAFLKTFGLACTNFSVFLKNRIIEVACMHIMHGLAHTYFNDYVNCS